MSKAKQRRDGSSVALTESLSWTVRAARIELSDLCRQADEEVVILSRKNASTLQRRCGDYPAETRAIRDIVRGLKAFLVEADIALVDDGNGLVASHSRAMARYFTLRDDVGEPRFDQNGRLFCGFWSNLRKDRRQGIRIEGEAVVNPDYSPKFPRLAYASIEATAPDSDIFAIPDLEGNRRAVNYLLMDDFHRLTWPTELVTSTW